jgi:ketosteroid isomerase-like protein
MEARSVEKLAEIVDPELLVLEGVHKNVGWPDYRDNHIGPEMKEWREFKAQDPRILEVEVHGDLAYAVQEATFTIVMADATTVTLAGAETFVLRKGASGWRIKHVHFSGKKKGPAPAARP